MPKRGKRQGRLIQKPKVENNAEYNQSLQAAEGKYRIIAMGDNFNEVWVEGEYNTLKSAKQFIDVQSDSSISYYVHSDSSRVLYWKKGEVNG